MMSSNQLAFFLKFVSKFSDNKWLNLICINLDASTDSLSKYENIWSHKSLGLVDKINFALVKLGIFYVIDAKTATWVDINFSLFVSADALGVFNNIESRSKVTR